MCVVKENYRLKEILPAFNISSRINSCAIIPSSERQVLRRLKITTVSFIIAFFIDLW